MDARCLHLLQEAGRDSSEKCLFLHAVFHPVIVFGGITAIVANRLLWFTLGHWAHSLLCSMWWLPHLANWSKRPSLGVPRRLYSGPPPQRGGCERGRSPSGMARWPGTSCRCGWGLGGTRRGGRTVLGIIIHCSCLRSPHIFFAFVYSNTGFTIYFECKRLSEVRLEDWVWGGGGQYKQDHKAAWQFSILEILC